MALAALVAAGQLFVGAATSLAAAFGIDAYMLGAIVVAFGTSLPELVTVLLSRLRGWGIELLAAYAIFVSASIGVSR